MKLTKFEHSCMVLEKGGSVLVIDPGSYTAPLEDLGGVVAIVITHEHADHWSAEHLSRLLDRNPNARIIGSGGVAALAAEFSVEVVTDGDELEVDPFSLRFFGKQHAMIHSSIPIIDNVGVLVDDNFYYGGDSFTVPAASVQTLAVPIGAPWLKIAEVMDYVDAIKPKRAIPAHEAVLSVIGRNMANGRVDMVTTLGGGEFFPLEPGESLEI
jgi:L-ascorbate metabolism protein UlaG (beta-lactamase superfamily)